MSTLKDTAKELSTTLKLTTDDSKAFELHGDFGIMCERAIEKIGEKQTFYLTKHSVRPITARKKTMQATDLFFVAEEDPKVQLRCTILFDLQNIFLSSDKYLSLKELGQGTDGKDILASLAMFTVDAVTRTGRYPMKYSLASERLGFSIEHKYSDDEMAQLRTKYRESDELKAGRTDASRDISWLEIKHTIITPLD